MASWRSEVHGFYIYIYIDDTKFIHGISPFLVCCIGMLILFVSIASYTRVYIHFHS